MPERPSASLLRFYDDTILLPAAYVCDDRGGAGRVWG
jgi:hypothetical protein